MATAAGNAASAPSTEEEATEVERVADLAEVRGSIVAAIFAVETLK